MDTPLVSIVVVTYNSSKTIIDTLDSIYHQTYPSIELMISDDGSTDNTSSLCMVWLSSHNEKFINSRLITHSVNQGTVKNLNCGVRASSGKWVKIIAGDDKMIPQAIQKYIKFCSINPECRMCVSDMELFSDDEIIPKSTFEAYSRSYEKSKSSQKTQWRMIQKELFFTGPSFYFSRTLFEEIGGFNENYVLMEEWPFCFEVLKRGYRIYSIPEKLILYRVSSNSVCHSNESGLGNKILFMDTRRFFYKKRLPQLLSNGKIISAYCAILDYEKEYNKYKHSIWNKFLVLVYKIINPAFWYRHIFTK